MDQPRDANGVLRDTIDRWVTDGTPPSEVRLENVKGEWTVPLTEFLAFMAGEGGDTMPSATCEAVQELTGQEVGAYGPAADALLAVLERERS